MKQKVFNLIIVDESGSMGVIQKQAFSGMNETLQTVRLMQQQYPEKEQHVSLVTFDSEHTKWHYDNTPASQTKDLAWTDYQPCGCTPLYDAMGMAMSKVNAQADKGDSVLVTVITDGEENASREWTLKMVRQFIEKQKEQGWTVALIGTDNLDVESMAHSMAIDDHLKFAEDAEGTSAMFACERKSRMRFNACLAAAMPMKKGNFFKEE